MICTKKCTHKYTPYIICVVHFVKVVTHQLYVTIIHRLNFIRLLQVVITPSGTCLEEKTTRSNRMNFRLNYTLKNVEKWGQVRKIM